MQKHIIGLDYTDIVSDRKNKRDLPFILKMKKTIALDKALAQLSMLLQQSSNENNYNFDKASSEHNYNLSNTHGVNFVSNYEDIYKTYAKIGFQSLSDDALLVAAKIDRAVETYTPYERAKGMKNTSSKSYHPYYDERNYTKKTEYCNGYIEEFLDSFSSESCRSAIVTLQPGKFLSPHFDIGPEYVVRLQIPIISNEHAVIGFRASKDVWHEYHLPADGAIYAVNSGWEHYAVNNGFENRYQIRVCLNGQDDLNGAEEVLPTRIFSHEVFKTRPESGNYYGTNDNNIMATALTELGMNAVEYSKYAAAQVK